MSGTGSNKARPLAFILASIALVASGFAFSRPASPPRAATPASVRGATTARQIAARSAQLNAEVEAAARRFLASFFRYEVGDIDASVRSRLRATATSQFARALLAAPPRATSEASFPPPAEVRTLHVVFAGAEAFQAFVEGSARRAGEQERFSFEFRYAEGAWRASGVPE